MCVCVSVHEVCQHLPIAVFPMTGEFKAIKRHCLEIIIIVITEFEQR